MNKIYTIFSWAATLFIFIVMCRKQISPNSFNNYLEIIDGLQNIFIFITGTFLALLGSIGIFKEYSFLKKLFQLNVDLKLTKILSVQIFFGSLLIFVSIISLMFKYNDETLISTIFISSYISLTVKFLINIAYISNSFRRILKNYLREEEKERKNGVM